MKIFVLTLMSFLFISCSSLYIDSNEVTLYKSGVKIFQKQGESSKLQVELGQEKINYSNPLIFFVAVENLKDENILFDIDNVNIINADKTLHPLRFNELSSNFSMQDNLYSFGLYSKPIYENDSGYFSPFIYPYPARFFYYPYGVFLDYGYYNYSLGRAQVQRQINDDSTRAIIFRNYLKKTTLIKKEAQGGFIAIPSSMLKDGNLELNIIVGMDVYKILFILRDKK